MLRYNLYTENLNFGLGLQDLPKNIIYMKCATHASENPIDIINRKIDELNTAGVSFWGYGGNLCHPINQVHPFLMYNKTIGEKTYLVLSLSKSQYNVKDMRARYYSKDKKEWMEIPQGINVIGSPQAIVCNNIEKCHFVMDLSEYLVPIGPSCGKKLSQILSWHINKSCGRLVNNPQSMVPTRPIVISAIAEIETAVFVS